MRRLLPVLLLSLFLVGCQFTAEPAPAPPPPPLIPVPVPVPRPKPPCPGPGPCPRDVDAGRSGRSVEAGSSTAKVGGRVSPDGTEEIQIDLPGRFHVKNRGGSDGAGLCVFASLRHSGTWADEPVFAGLFEYMFAHPGGGYPEKVDRMVEAYARERGLGKPSYLQIEANDLEPLRLACARGLLPGVTYCYSPTGRYGGSRVSHMVSLPHCTQKWCAVLDNNYPGEDQYEWMSPDEFLKVSSGGKTAWFVIPLKDGPPPVPKN